MSYSFRQATEDDIPFITKIIIGAEKSGSNQIGLANVFGLSEKELTLYLTQMFEEEIEGCEFSLSSYMLVERNGQVAGGIGGWIEEENEDNQKSAVLKSNLLAFTLPKDKFVSLQKNQEIIQDLIIERTPHVHQFEYAYVDPVHRGHGLMSKLINESIRKAQVHNPNLERAQLHVFENNARAIKVYEKCGYRIVKRQASNHPKILDMMPWNVKLLMEKKVL